jgi:hypothetical protein
MARITEQDAENAKLKQQQAQQAARMAALMARLESLEARASQ